MEYQAGQQPRTEMELAFLVQPKPKSRAAVVLFGGTAPIDLTDIKLSEWGFYGDPIVRQNFVLLMGRTSDFGGGHIGVKIARER
jgi:hypothetical protein